MLNYNKRLADTWGNSSPCSVIKFDWCNASACGGVIPAANISRNSCLVPADTGRWRRDSPAITTWLCAWRNATTIVWCVLTCGSRLRVLNTTSRVQVMVIKMFNQRVWMVDVWRIQYTWIAQLIHCHVDRQVHSTIVWVQDVYPRTSHTSHWAAILKVLMSLFYQHWCSITLPWPKITQIHIQTYWQWIGERKSAAIWVIASRQRFNA